MHMLLACCLHRRGNELILFVHLVSVLLLLPVQSLVRVPSLVQALSVLVAFHRHHVVVLHVVGHS